MADPLYHVTFLLANGQAQDTWMNRAEMLEEPWISGREWVDQPSIRRFKVRDQNGVIQGEMVAAIGGVLISAEAAVALRTMA